MECLIERKEGFSVEGEKKDRPKVWEESEEREESGCRVIRPPQKKNKKKNTKPKKKKKNEPHPGGKTP